MKKKALIIGNGIAGPALALFLKRLGIDSEIYEARPEGEETQGFFLYLAPNGMKVLRELGLEKTLRADAIETTGITFYNARGRQIGELDSRDDETRYGARGVVIKRAHLHRVLRDAVSKEGIPLTFGKKLDRLHDTDRGVSAHFEDGSSAEGDVLIGCDGIHSRTRRLITPTSPAPSYGGLIDCGGFAHCPALRSLTGPQHMTFGKNAFFAYVVHPNGDVYWFSNVPQTNEPTRADLRAITQDTWKKKLLALHANDPHPIPDIIQATPPERMGAWPLRDIPSLTSWHKGRVCLIGDAAHATSPSSGQGASLALESAILLAKQLGQSNDIQQAYRAFQHIRQPRVEHVIRQARQNGERKIPHPIMGFIRDLLLPTFLKAGTKATQQTYSYTVSWNE